MDIDVDLPPTMSDSPPVVADDDCERYQTLTVDKSGGKSEFRDYIPFL